MIIWADELGTIAYGDSQQPYFGFGTVASLTPLSELAAKAEELRYSLSMDGVDLSKGFHCRDDSYDTRTAFFALVHDHVEDFNATLLCKENAYGYVKSRGDMHLYRMAWYLHIKYLVERYGAIADRFHVVVGSFNTRKRAREARTAIYDVCKQFPVDIVVSVWDAHSTIGLQAADYCLWALYQKIKGKPTWHDKYVSSVQTRSTFYPWGVTKGPP